MITVQRNTVQTGKTTPRGVQFLKPDHVMQPTAAKIVKLTIDKPDNYGNPYVCYFSFGGVTYSKGYKPTADALARLVDLFGNDESKWSDRDVILSATEDAEGGLRLAYDVPTTKGQPKRAA